MRAHEGVDDAAAAAVGGYGRHRGHEVPVPVDAAKFNDCEGRVNKTRKKKMVNARCRVPFSGPVPLRSGRNTSGRPEEQGVRILLGKSVNWGTPYSCGPRWALSGCSTRWTRLVNVYARPARITLLMMISKVRTIRSSSSGTVGCNGTRPSRLPRHRGSTPGTASAVRTHIPQGPRSRGRCPPPSFPRKRP